MSLLKSKSLFHCDFQPDRDWRFLFCIFLALTMVSFVAAIYLYRVLDTLEVVSQERMILDSSTRLDQTGLEQVVKNLAEKQARFEAFLATPPAIVDPAR